MVTEEENKLVFKRVRIDSKIYTFVLTKKQEVEFQDILKMKDENKAIEYIKLHFGYFLNIDYKKAYDCLNKLYNYYCYRF